MHTVKLVGNGFLCEFLGVYPFDFHVRRVFIARMRERFGNRQICVVKLNVLSAQRDFDRLVPRGNSFEHFVPLGEVDYARVHFKTLADDFGKIAFFEHYGALI